jgi:hypothetical protein
MVTDTFLKLFFHTYLKDKIAYVWTMKNFETLKFCLAVIL